VPCARVVGQRGRGRKALELVGGEDRRRAVLEAPCGGEVGGEGGDARVERGEGRLEGEEGVAVRGVLGEKARVERDLRLGDDGRLLAEGP